MTGLLDENTEFIIGGLNFVMLCVGWLAYVIGCTIEEWKDDR